MISTVV